MSLYLTAVTVACCDLVSLRLSLAEKCFSLEILAERSTAEARKSSSVISTVNTCSSHWVNIWLVK